MEEFLAMLEGMAAPILDKLETGEAISSRERFRLAYFLGFLFCRTARFERSLNEILTGLSTVILRRNLEDPLTAGNFDLPPEELLEYLDSGEFSLLSGHNLRLQETLKQGPKAGKHFFMADWVVVQAEEKTAFATCDNPFGLLVPPEVSPLLQNRPWGLASPEIIVAFPISSRSCLLMFNIPVGFKREVVSRERVREINLTVLKGTEIYAISRDEAHLKSLAYAAGLHESMPETRIVVENHPDPTGDPLRSILVTRLDRKRVQ